MSTLPGVAVFTLVPALIALWWPGTGSHAAVLTLFGALAATCLVPAAAGRDTPAWRGLAATGAGCFAAIWTGWLVTPLEPVALVLLAGGMTLMTWLILGLRALLASRLSPSISAAHCVVLLCITGAAPLWLAAVAEYAAPPDALASLAAAASPLSFIAGLLDHDYLHNAWWYRHSALAALPHRVPGTAGSAIALAVIVAGCEAVLWQIARAGQDATGHSPLVTAGESR